MFGRIVHHHAFSKRRLIALFSCFLLLISASSAAANALHLDRQIRQWMISEAGSPFQEDRRCPGDRQYRVYLIDNFEQVVDLVPEVSTSHGEMLAKILKTGRDDIELVVLNTALSKGLKQVIQDLIEGQCVDAVVSSVPGSNYTYGQIGSLLPGRPAIDRTNILYYRSALRQLLGDIALRGFPSVEWLERIDVNAAKLRNDARKYMYIEALGRFTVPVILPYGNSDVPYKGQIKSVNLLSLAANARVYSALDQEGQRVGGFPYSPLSTGDERAVYDIMECPHPDDPFKAVLDINHDGYPDYTYFRSDRIAYRNAQGALAFSPPVLKPDQFVQWLAQLETTLTNRYTQEVVLTADQYAEIKWLYPSAQDIPTAEAYIWLNSPKHGPVFAFDAACWKRGTLVGTSVIPPNKLRELLPPKTGLAAFREVGQILGFLDR